jgi:hypothetical protein
MSHTRPKQLFVKWLRNGVELGAKQQRPEQLFVKWLRNGVELVVKHVGSGLR